jgi:hypothetical protein
VTVLCEWEKERVFGGSGGSGLLGKTRAAESLRARARAWAGHLGRGRIGAVGACVRSLALGLPAAPLTANYEAAYLLLACSGPLVGEDETERDRRLLDEAYRIAPARERARGAFRERWLSLRGDVGAFWNREVMGSTRPPGPVESG